MFMRYFDVFSEEYFPLAFNFKSVDDENSDFFNNFLVQNALIDQRQGYGTTHIFLEVDEKDSKNKRILGFFTLRCSSLIIRSEGFRKIGEPALEIAVFAVHKDYRGMGIGTVMMQEIFAQAIKLKEKHIGIKYLVLCSVKESMGFYEKFEFKQITGNELIPNEIRNLECIPMSVRLPEDINI